MIVVKVELHSARTGIIKQLARMHICNDGTADSERLGNYIGTVLRAPNFQAVTRAATENGYRRKDLPVWTLITRLLNKMEYGEM